MLAAVAVTRLEAVKEEWRLHRNHAFGIAVLSPAAYILVLYALAISPVSYVAPAREIGILFGALMGARWLGERDVERRLGGAVAMVLGVVALAVG
jgi:drug/metabolite transporter (DMT)-like permease